MLIEKIKAIFYYTFRYPIYKIYMGSIGNRSRIIFPLKIDGPSNIFIGNKVIIEYKTWLAACPQTNANICRLEIGDGTKIGHFNHIYATGKISIGKKVLTADKVYITDNLHNYSDIAVAVLEQPIKQLNEIVIGDGSWLGENVCIIGASVGKGCVIGANSVVTKDIANYCIAVGVPAKIIKRYCFKTSSWKRTNSKGDFLI